MIMTSTWMNGSRTTRNPGLTNLPAVQAIKWRNRKYFLIKIWNFPWWSFSPSTSVLGHWIILQLDPQAAKQFYLCSLGHGVRLVSMDGHKTGQTSDKSYNIRVFIVFVGIRLKLLLSSHHGLWIVYDGVGETMINMTEQQPTDDDDSDDAKQRRRRKTTVKQLKRPDQKRPTNRTPSPSFARVGPHAEKLMTRFQDSLRPDGAIKFDHHWNWNTQFCISFRLNSTIC